MVIRNGLVLTDEGFVKGHLVVDKNHRIAAVPGGKEGPVGAAFPEEGKDTGNVRPERTEEIIEAEGFYVLPGLVDVHIHGAVGKDFCDGDPAGLGQIAAYLKSCGVTSFCPTSMTLSAQELLRIFPSILQAPEGAEYARALGIHMEGPFLAPEKKGAQKASHIREPDIALFQELNKACGGRIRLVTLAPERPGAAEFIEALHDRVSISLGHSSAGYEIADEAYKAGANHGTHLFNAMPPFHHRDPGIIGAAADHSHVMVEVICDGIHIHPAVIRAVFRLFGEDRVILISDAIRAAGMEDGLYELGGQEVHKKGSRATLSDGTLAGSVTNLFDCMKNAVNFGIPLRAAVKAASQNPARSIGEKGLGRIAPGMEADLLLVDRDLNLVRVL